MVQRARADKDAFFGSDAHSPVPAAARGPDFSLAYFAPEPAWRIAAQWHPAATLMGVRVQTSTGEARDYVLAGHFAFNIDDTPCRLVGYATSADALSLFVPFKDATAGHETYGTGRYLDVEMPPADGGPVVLDFNAAYNPFCAYSEQWSCPLTPPENVLSVAIRAGEKVPAW